MSGAAATVGGDWTGVYDYGGSSADPVPFVAMLFDIGGAVWGTTEEPNSFALETRRVLLADVNGSRSGREVRFTKVYQGKPRGGEYPIQYAGVLSPDGRRIEGTWVITSALGTFGGPFVMNRNRGAVAERAIEREAATEIGETIDL